MSPMMIMPGAKTKEDWLVTQITALIYFGGDECMEKAKLLADYYVYQLDGQDMYDLGGES